MIKISNIAKLLLVFLFSIFTYEANSKSITYYHCDFENLSDNGKWVLNSGPNGSSSKATNKWCISNAESYTNESSLIISNDNGNTATYSNTTNYMVAYRELELEDGKYDISFMWKCAGDGGNDGLYVGWVDKNTNLNSAFGGNLPIKDKELIFDGKKLLSGTSEWTEATATITVSRTEKTKRLAFVWASDSKISAAMSVCIDNIQIAKEDKFCKPSNVYVSSPNGTDAKITWKGFGEYYELMYKNQETNESTHIDSIKNVNEYTVADLNGGNYDFWVRSICNSDTSVWVGYRNMLIYTSGVSCVDFTRLNSPDVICNTGDFGNPYIQTGIVDYGYKDGRSRHTIHYSKDERDPRTNYMLKTVPEGELASVRLGNWQAGGYAESITYNMSLAENSNVLLTLNYAVVLEAPGHGHSLDPRFKLDILDENGVGIGGTCTKADFTADTKLAGWNTFRPSSDSVIVWKDWTKIGINLTPYAGQNIKIRLTTYDCQPNAHFGYAYFTLGCSTAEISGTSCGDNQALAISAPEGFDYEWYKQSDPNTIVSKDKDYNVVGGDTAAYCCDVIFKEDKNCYFTLNASLLPRYPKAKFAYKWEPKDCENYIKFENSSGITTVRGMTTEKLDSMVWDFGNGIKSTEKSPLIKYPAEGGNFTVSLAVSMNGGECRDTMKTTINIPPVGESVDTVSYSICKGSDFNGQTESGIYKYVHKRITGCDSIVYVDLKVIDKLDTTVIDTICAGSSYSFNGQDFSKTGEYSATTKSTYGCDSTTTLQLFVRDELNFDCSAVDANNGPNSGEIIITGADKTWTYTINNEKNGALDSLAKGSYTIIFTDENGCESEPQTIIIDAQCLDVSITQNLEICADEDIISIPYEIIEGNAKTYNIDFSTKAEAVGFVDQKDLYLEGNTISIPTSQNRHIRPDSYTFDIVFNDQNCGELQKTISLNVLYQSTITVQKWNDVIATLSYGYNGGYDFVGYQWYCNSQPLAGETGTYLYLADDVFDLNDSFFVELTRSDDGKKIRSCPITPIIKFDINDYPTRTVALTNEKIQIESHSGNYTATWYDILGRKHSTCQISEYNTDIITPDKEGLYILEITTETSRSVHKIYIKE